MGQPGLRRGKTNALGGIQIPGRPSAKGAPHRRGGGWTYSEAAPWGKSKKAETEVRPRKTNVGPKAGKELEPYFFKSTSPTLRNREMLETFGKRMKVKFLGGKKENENTLVRKKTVFPRKNHSFGRSGSTKPESRMRSISGGGSIKT